MARLEIAFEVAWIFASLRPAGRTPLTELVARADFLNHAIPTAAEIRAALERLFGLGLVDARDRAVVLTALGRRVHADGLGRRGGPFAVVENMRKALRSPRHALVEEPRAARPPFRFVTEASVAKAYAAYMKLVNR